MMSNIAKSIAVSFILVLTGCAGKDFVRITDDALVLGETTQEQIKNHLGRPYQEGTLTKNDHLLSTASYAYASTGGKAVAAGVTPARSQGFYFYDGKLVGYEFTSSFADDSTDFNSAKVAEIKEGVSTLNDVVRMLGKPGGKYIYPVTSSVDEEAVTYLYQQTRGSAFNLRQYRKLLVVTVDRQGIVTEVEYVESGQK